MKKTLYAIMLLAVSGFMPSVVIAAELLEVKPVVVGDAVKVEISADVEMTYTFYKVPGQARAVVDIAEADPEKVEPLIVVNKGILSSISVDKAQISGIVVSRIIFNLVSESDLSVTASPDRKLLTVTFGGSVPAAKSEPKPELKPEPTPEPVAKVETPAIAATASPAGTGPEADPLGLDEPAVTSAPSVAKEAAAAATTAVALSGAAAAISTAPTVMRIPKLEPVVPVPVPVAASDVTPAQPSALSIKGIVAGSSYIEILTNQSVTNYKESRISSPDRLIIDIACERTDQRPKTVAINKFGISKARVGVSPKNIRIVFDSSKAGIPAHTITDSAKGLRINID